MPNTVQLKTLGQIIRDARKQKKWTLQELADRSRVGHSYLSNIERGYVNPQRGPVTPSDDILAALSDALDVPLSTLHAALGRIETATVSSPRPMMTFVEQKLNEGADGDIVDLTEDQADQLVAELEELAEMRINQVRRQSQSQTQTGAGEQKQAQKQAQKQEKLDVKEEPKKPRSFKVY